MKKRVIDASVAAKWVFPEEGSNEAALLLRSMVAGELELIAPDSFVSEIGNIAWKKTVLRKEISAQEATESLGFLISVLPRMVPSSILVEAALEIAMTHRRSVYDCLYVALALQEECDFVTADRTLVRTLGGAFSCIIQL